MKIRGRSALAAVLVACGGTQTQPPAQGVAPATPGVHPTATAIGSQPLAGAAGSQTGAARRKPVWTSAPMAMADRAAAMQRAGAKFDELRKGSQPAQANAAMAAYLKKQPELEAAAATHTGAWGRFKDGRLAVFVNDPSIDAAIRRSPKRGAAERTEAHPMLALGVPGGDEPAQKSFRAIETLGIDDTVQARSNIATYLSGQGYTAGSSGGNVEDLKMDSSVGALYFNTHGGMGSLADRVTDTSTVERGNVYVMMTATPVYDANGQPITTNSYSGFKRALQNPQQYEAWLADGHLAYMYASVASGPQWSYGITNLWVQDYWQFDPSAVVLLTVCSSMARPSTGGGNPGEPGAAPGWDPDPASALPDVLAQKVALAVGWTEPVGVDEGLGVAQFAFDRMLGANQWTTWGTKNPPERPWDWLETMQEIQSLGHGQSVGSAGVAQLAFVGGDAILAPSISTIDMEESAKQIILNGSFGKDPGDGKVTLSDTPTGSGSTLSGCSWQPQTIKCTVDGTQAGYAQVVSHGHKSNVVAVTRFKVKLSWHLRGGGARDKLDVKATEDVTLRVDVQSWRRHAKDDPKPRDPFRVAPSQDSKCNLTTSGYGPGPNGSTIPITGSGTGDVVGPYASVVPPANPAMGPNMAGLAGLQLPAGVPAGILGSMPDPALGAMAAQGKCMLGGMLDPTVGTKFAASINIPSAIIVKGYASNFGFDVRMFEKKKDVQAVIAGLTLNMKMVTSPQGGATTLVGDHLEQDSKDGKDTITLDWQDANGEYPPDASSAR